MPNRHVSQLGILSMNKASIAIYAYCFDTRGVWHRILYFLGERLGSLFKVILNAPSETPQYLTPAAVDLNIQHKEALGWC